MKITQREIGILQSALTAYINEMNKQMQELKHRPQWNYDIRRLQSRIDISKNLLGKLEEILQWVTKLQDRN